METAEKILEKISKKLGVLIALNLDSNATATDHIKTLDRFGLTPAEIGEILNKSPDYVSVVKSNAKKNSKIKK